jgi:hypothetical protein
MGQPLLVDAGYPTTAAAPIGPQTMKDLDCNDYIVLPDTIAI